MTLKEAMRYVESLSQTRLRREPAWRRLSRWLIGYRGAFEESREDGIYDEELFRAVAQNACLRAASGMTSGMTPRNVAWFKPVFNDARLAEASGARAWLDELDGRIKDCLARGGFYQAIQSFNLDLVWAGCALLYCERGTNEFLRFECCQIGSFDIAQDHEKRLCAVARHISMTPSSMAEVFGADKLSESTRSRLDSAPHEERPVTHLVLRESLGRFPIASYYYEEGGRDFLRKGGYNEMPFFFTCWHEGVTPYGQGPGDECIADARQLDLLERRKLAALGKLADPPVLVDNPNLKEELELGPGAINYIANGHQILPIFDLGPTAASLAQIQREIEVVTKRMQDGLMATIFDSMPLNQRPADMSATEYLERKREAMQLLGPVISAYEPDVLTPVLERVAFTLDRASALPPVPESLANAPLLMKIEFISPMANALRQSGAEATRGLVADALNILKGSGNSEILDKIDLDQAIDELAAGIGAPGAIIRADEDVARIRQQRAAMQQQQQNAEQAAHAMQLASQAQQMAAQQKQMENGEF